MQNIAPAAAVATGQADIGLGSDTAGSVRVPASVCGLFGMRPAQDVISASGLLHLAPCFGTAGWLTADPELLAVTGSVLLPPGPADPPRRLLSPDFPNGPLRLLADTLDLVLDTGPVLDDAAVSELLAAFRVVQAAEAWRLYGGWITANPGALGADVAARFRVGAELSAHLSARGRGRRQWRAGACRGLRRDAATVGL